MGVTEEGGVTAGCAVVASLGRIELVRRRCAAERGDKVVRGDRGADVECATRGVAAASSTNESGFRLGAGCRSVPVDVDGHASSGCWPSEGLLTGGGAADVDGL